MNLLSAIQPYVVGIIIGLTVVQYVFAIFCLLKLAYLDITKREYVLWNLFILLVIFIGGIVFLIYLKKGNVQKIPPYMPNADDGATIETEEQTADVKTETDEKTEETASEEPAENADETEEKNESD